MNKLAKGLIGLCMLCVTGCSVSTSYSTGGLEVVDFKFTQGKDGPALDSNATFRTGEEFNLAFVVKGFKISPDSQVWVQEDLKVLGPDDKVVLTKEKILDLHTTVPAGADVVNASNSLVLNPDTPPGKYKVSINVLDKVGDKTASYNQTITVETGTAAPTTPAPGAEEPAATETPDAGATPEETATPEEPEPEDTSTPQD